MSFAPPARRTIDKTGCITLRIASKMHHIGISRTHSGTHVLVLVNDLEVTIINAATGELLRELTLDPSRDYQPQKPQNALPKESES